MKIFTCGCFDLFHPGHMHFFHEIQSRWPNAKLFVSVASDSLVKSLKGDGRPFIPLSYRIVSVEHYTKTRSVAIHKSDENLRFILSNLRPDVLVKGEGSGPTPGQEFAKEIVFLPLLEGWSTTQLAERIAHAVRGS